jgi:hypothetical protein
MKMKLLWGEAPYWECFVCLSVRLSVATSISGLVGFSWGFRQKDPNVISTCNMFAQMHEYEIILYLCICFLGDVEFKNQHGFDVRLHPKKS